MQYVGPDAFYAEFDEVLAAFSHARFQNHPTPFQRDAVRGCFPSTAVSTEMPMSAVGAHLPTATHRSQSQIGEQVVLRAKRVPHFKAGKGLRERVGRRN